ncbi:hypothetical protein CI238_11453, partial [Colletotrichum incanum]
LLFPVVPHPAAAVASFLPFPSHFPPSPGQSTFGPSAPSLPFPSRLTLATEVLDLVRSWSVLPRSAFCGPSDFISANGAAYHFPTQFPAPASFNPPFHGNCTSQLLTSASLCFTSSVAPLRPGPFLSRKRHRCTAKQRTLLTSFVPSPAIPFPQPPRKPAVPSLSPHHPSNLPSPSLSHPSAFLCYASFCRRTPPFQIQTQAANNNRLFGTVSLLVDRRATTCVPFPTDCPTFLLSTNKQTSYPIDSPSSPAPLDSPSHRPILHLTTANCPSCLCVEDPRLSSASWCFSAMARAARHRC